MVSPSLMALRTATLKKFPKAKWVEYESFQRTEGRVGATLAFGEPVTPQTNFDKAKVILGLDSDFLGLDWQTPLPTKQYSSGAPHCGEEDLEKMNRLYAVESQFSMTGAQCRSPSAHARFGGKAVRHRCRHGAGSDSRIERRQ